MIVGPTVEPGQRGDPEHSLEPRADACDTKSDAQERSKRPERAKPSAKWEKGTASICHSRRYETAVLTAEVQTRILANWSVWLDSNQRPLASRARTLTRLSYTQKNSVRLRLLSPHPLSHYPQASTPAVRAYPPGPAETASTSCGMTAFLQQAAMPVYRVATRCGVYRLPCGQQRPAGHRATSHQRPPAWGTRSSWISPK